MSGEAPPGPILIALSGGGDSVALLHELVDRVGAARLVAGVIDHGVRAESADEAKQAAAWAEALGVTAAIVTLAWPDPRLTSKGSHSSLVVTHPSPDASQSSSPGPINSGESDHGPRTSPSANLGMGGAPPEAVRLKPNAARLRERRHQALCALARAHGAHVIALGHTRDDQIETFLMRLETARYWRELAGMSAWAPAPVWPEGRGVRLWRPLLERRRADLRAALTARGAAWIDDPSNEAIESARARARRHLAVLEARGFDPAPLSAATAKLRARAEAEDRAAGAWIAARVRFEEGNAVCGPAPDDPEIAARALAVLIAACAGARRLPERAGVLRLLAEPMGAATLGGARLETRRDMLIIGRDPGAILGRRGVKPLAPLALPAGEEAIWDNRLVVTATQSGWRITPRGLGADPAAPVFPRGDEALTLPEARAAGVVRAHWLAEERVNHLLLAAPRVFPVAGAVTAPARRLS